MLALSHPHYFLLRPHCVCFAVESLQCVAVGWSLLTHVQDAATAAVIEVSLHAHVL